jgi:hypothetical protein
MVHQSTNDHTPTIKQVEFNTIASSFGGLSSQTSRLHKLVIAKSQDSFSLPANHLTDILQTSLN